jgi:hypothetical protein
MDIGSFVGDDVLPVVYSIKRRFLAISARSPLHDYNRKWGSSYTATHRLDISGGCFFLSEITKGGEGVAEN